MLLLFFITVGRYFLIAGAGFYIFYRLLAGKLEASKIQVRKAANGQFLKEIFHSSLSSMALAITGYVAVWGPLRKFTLVYSSLDEWPWWWLPVSLVLCLVIHDTYFYWIHRAMHHKKIFRFTHLVHHESTNPSPWTSYSFQLLEAFLEGAVVILLVFILPLHATTIMVFAFVSFVVNVYGHLGYEIMPRQFRHSLLFEFINTSSYHNLHHLKFKGNYGLYFRFWDRLLKTENPEYVKEYDRIQEKRFGPVKKAISRPVVRNTAA